MEHTTFARPTIEHTHVGTACTPACLTRPCSCPVNKWNRSCRPRLCFFQIARPNIPNMPNFRLMPSCPHHMRHTVWYVCDRLPPCLQGNLYTHPCPVGLGIAQECIQHNTLSRFHFGNNRWGNRCTFQCQKALEIDRCHIWHTLFSGHHESFSCRRGRFHTM